MNGELPLPKSWQEVAATISSLVIADVPRARRRNLSQDQLYRLVERAITEGMLKALALLGRRAIDDDRVEAMAFLAEVNDDGVA